MNPIVLGALIGAGPALIATALATLSARYTARLGLAQTEMTLTANHDQWMRDKRGDQYVEMMKVLQNAGDHRLRTFQERKVTQELKLDIQRMIDSYNTPEMDDLVARVRVYASTEAARAFVVAQMGDITAWEAFLSAATLAESGSGVVAITEDLTSARQFAHTSAA